MNETRIDYLLDIGAFTTSMAQTEEMLRYVSLGLTILCTCVSIAYSVYKWWKKASKDGKITKEEIKELHDDIKETLDDKKEGE